MVKKFARSLKVFEFKAEADDPFDIMNGLDGNGNGNGNGFGNGNGRRKRNNNG